MAHTKSRRFARIGVVVSAAGFLLLIAAFVSACFETAQQPGITNAFRFWVYSVMLSILGIMFYLADAVWLIRQVVNKIYPVFNTILVVMIIGCIPMVVYIGGGMGANIAIWNGYYLVVFILEIISITRYTKKESKIIDSQNQAD